MNIKAKTINHPQYELTLQLNHEEACFLRFLFGHMNGAGEVDTTVSKAIASALNNLGLHYDYTKDAFLYDNRAANSIGPIFYRKK